MIIPDWPSYRILSACSLSSGDEFFTWKVVLQAFSNQSDWAQTTTLCTLKLFFRQVTVRSEYAPDINALEFVSDLESITG